ncbi:MAG: hypothetical protein JRJ45_12265 [Deltaproteobacteria bacterium]|nr:hypothetical protein [Deltaproteobacteria bacterium]
MYDQLKRVEKNLLAEEKELATPKQVEQMTGISQRVQQKMTKLGILPKPLRLGEGRKVFHNRKFITEELRAIAVFRKSFLCTLEDLTEMARNNKDKYFKDMIYDLNSHLEEINENSKGKKQGGILLWELGSNKLLHSFAEGYIRKLKKGLKIKNIKKYIDFIDYIIGKDE